MKDRIKLVVALVAAFGLVVMAGKFTADHSLKATDGEENIVAEVTEEVAVDNSEVEVVIENSADEAASEEAAENTEDAKATEEVDSDETADAEDDESADDEDLDDAEEEEEDEEEEDKSYEGTVSISSNVDISSPLKKGTKVTLTAKVDGFEGASYHFEWSKSTDGSNWEVISNASSEKYTFTLDEKTSGYQWRARVIVDD